MDSGGSSWRVNIHLEARQFIELDAQLDGMPVPGSPVVHFAVDTALDQLTAWFKACGDAQFEVVLRSANASPEMHRSSNGYLALYFVALVLERWLRSEAGQLAGCV